MTNMINRFFSNRQTAILAGILLIFSLFVTVYQLDKTSLHMDEVIWMVNSKELFYALLHRNSDFLRNAWWNNQKESYAIGLPATFLSGLSQFIFAGEGRYGLHLLSDIVAARLPGVLLSSTLPVIFFLVMSSYFSPLVAFIAAFAYSLSPASLTMSRWLLHDSLLNLFCFVSLVSFYYLHRQRKSVRFYLIPGIFFALALLTKPSAIFILLPWFYITFISPQNKTLTRLLFTLVVTFVTVQIIWPESWYRPVFAYLDYFNRQNRFANVGLMNFFLGKTNPDPGFWYYPFELVFKTQITVVLLFFAGIIALTKKRHYTNAYSRFLVYLSFFAIPYFIILSGCQAKPGVRYLLPIFPFLYLIVAQGISWLISKLPKSFVLPLLAIFTIDLFTLFVYHPDYQLYFNPLVGGAKGAKEIVRTNVCLGSKAALEYLDSQTVTGIVYIYGCQDNVPYYSSRDFTKNLDTADIFVVEQYLAQLYPDDVKLKYIYQHHLLHQVIQYGVTTATIYQR